MSSEIPSTPAAAAAIAVAGVPGVVDTFEACFERDYPPVARMAYLLLGGTGKAEEVTQEAFATLLERWDRVDNPSGFVRTAVMNRCRDVGRRRAVRARALRRLRSVDHEPDAGAAARPDTRHDVILALQRLDEQLRELVVLRYYLDHTVDQIAGIVGTPAGTVKSRLHQALAELGRHLDSP